MLHVFVSKNYVRKLMADILNCKIFNKFKPIKILPCYHNELVVFDQALEHDAPIWDTLDIALNSN